MQRTVRGSAMAAPPRLPASHGMPLKLGQSSCDAAVQLYGLDKPLPEEVG